MNKDNNKTTYRVTTFLDRQELDFLDELEKDLYFTHGLHIPRAKLIEEIIRAFQEKGNKEMIEQELIRKLTQGLGRRQP